MNHFDEAEKAYKLNQNQESLKEALMAHRCLKDEMGFEMAVQKYQVPEALLQEVREEVTLAGSSDVLSSFENNLQTIAGMNTPAQRAEYHKAISNIIFNFVCKCK